MFFEKIRNFFNIIGPGGGSDDKDDDILEFAQNLAFEDKVKKSGDPVATRKEIEDVVGDPL